MIHISSSSALVAICAAANASPPPGASSSEMDKFFSVADLLLSSVLAMHTSPIKGREGDLMCRSLFDRSVRSHRVPTACPPMRYTIDVTASVRFEPRAISSRVISTPCTCSSALRRSTSSLSPLDLPPLSPPLLQARRYLLT